MTSKVKAELLSCTILAIYLRNCNLIVDFRSCGHKLLLISNIKIRPIIRRNANI